MPVGDKKLRRSRGVWRGTSSTVGETDKPNAIHLIEFGCLCLPPSTVSRAAFRRRGREVIPGKGLDAARRHASPLRGTREQGKGLADFGRSSMTARRQAPCHFVRLTGASIIMGSGTSDRESLEASNVRRCPPPVPVLDCGRRLPWGVCEKRMERLTGMFVVPTLVGLCFEKEPH